MDSSLSSISLSVAVAFRQRQLTSDNVMLTLRNGALEQENNQLQSENTNLRLQQQVLGSDNRDLRQQVGDLQRELNAPNNRSNTTGGAQSTSALDVYA